MYAVYVDIDAAVDDRIRIPYEKVSSKKNQQHIWLSDDDVNEKSGYLGLCADLLREGLGKMGLDDAAALGTAHVGGVGKGRGYRRDFCRGTFRFAAYGNVAFCCGNGASLTSVL